MSYILITDYDKTIRRNHLEAVIDGNIALRQAAERAAIQEAAGYLTRARYDTELIFLEFEAYDLFSSYPEGESVSYEPPTWQPIGYGQGEQVIYEFSDGTWIAQANILTLASQTPEDEIAWTKLEPLIGIWTALSDTPIAAVPHAQAGYWKQDDPRHQLLLMYIIDIAIWHLLSRTDPSAIPEVRITRYEQAITWLLQVAKGQVSDPYLPTLETEAADQSGGFFMSSHPRQDFDL